MFSIMENNCNIIHTFKLQNQLFTRILKKDEDKNILSIKMLILICE